MGVLLPADVILHHLPALGNEYKSRMELSDRVKKIYQLDDRAGDQIQLRLNIWMLYLCTGLMTHTGYIVQPCTAQQTMRSGLWSVVGTSEAVRASESKTGYRWITWLCRKWRADAIHSNDIASWHI